MEDGVLDDGASAQDMLADLTGIAHVLHIPERNDEMFMKFVIRIKN